ncbi:MAG: response regulator [Acidobacteriota bacterium]
MKQQSGFEDRPLAEMWDGLEQPVGRLLFVDDEPSVLDLFSRMLEGQNWESHFCTSVEEALACLRSLSVDTVISDIRMPGRDGFELLAEIRGNPRTRNIPVIIITGDSDRALKRQALDLGATDLLNKPVSREDLLARIRSSLRLKHYQDRLARQVEELDYRVRERTRQLEASHREIVWRLAKAAEYRDDQTGYHVVRVAVLSRLLAEGLGMDQDFQDLIFLTSPLHDIGKLGIPDSILLKEGKLSPAERRLMEQHCVMGAEILSQEPSAISVSSLRGGEIVLYRGARTANPLLEMAASIALGHHERWDGTGYPRRLKGQAIPLECRIVSMADVFDALTSWRPYKPPLPDREAVQMVVKCSGTHFDPVIVDAFVRNREQILELWRQFEEEEAEEHR